MCLYVPYAAVKITCSPALSEYLEQHAHAHVGDELWRHVREYGYLRRDEAQADEQAYVGFLDVEAVGVVEA